MVTGGICALSYWIRISRSAFVEVRRRTKVIGRFPGETSALSLIWAVLELSSRGWRAALS